MGSRFISHHRLLYGRRCLVWLPVSGFMARGIGYDRRTNYGDSRNKGAMMFVWGLLLTLAQALGLLWVLNLAGAKRLAASLKTAFWLFVMIAAPLLAYTCLYGTYPLEGILMDYGHILLGWLAMGAIYAAFRGKDKIDAS